MYSLFHIVSDIHIEREYPKIPKWNTIINKRSENIILAGDVGHLELFDQYDSFISHICSNFTNVILIPGNHEFYSDKYDFKTLYKYLLVLKNKYNNLTILDNDYIDLEGNIRIYGTTLWCHIPQENIKKDVPIIDNNEKINNNWLNKNNKQCIEKIHDIILKSQYDKKRLIIASHYSPSIYNIDPRNYSSETKFFYFSNLEYLFKQHYIYTWIFGHTHYNKDYYSKYNTRIISNQYRAKNFKKNKIIKINHYNKY